jgi:hypothetical protein
MNEWVGRRETHACVREGNRVLLVYRTIFYFAEVVLVSAINCVYVLLFFTAAELQFLIIFHILLYGCE